MTKNPNFYGVYLSDPRAEKLAEFRDKFKSETLGDILMAGVDRLWGASNSTEKERDLWFERLMGATISKDGFHIDFHGGKLPASGEYDYVVHEYFDCYQVLRENTTSNSIFGKTYYAGTRAQCEAVAAHLNGLLEEVRGE